MILEMPSLNLARINNFPRRHSIRHRQRILQKRHRRVFFVRSRLAAEQPFNSIDQRGNKRNPPQQLR
jgi:hypothetical protein